MTDAMTVKTLDMNGGMSTITRREMYLTSCRETMYFKSECGRIKSPDLKPNSKWHSQNASEVNEIKIPNLELVMEGVKGMIQLDF